MSLEIFTGLDSGNLTKLAERLLSGHVAVIPTDTVYGLVAAAQSPAGIFSLYELKPRERQPGTTIAACAEDLIDLGFPRVSVERAATAWPAPLSVEMDAAGIETYLSRGQNVMAARVPNNEPLLRLLSLTGPLMTTSANRSGEPTAQTVHQAIETFGEQVDFYVDGGDLADRAPSTIIGFDSTGGLVVYRQGAVDVSVLQ